MAERLGQKLAKLYPPSPLASLCFGVSHGLPGTKPLSVHVSGAETRILVWSRFISAKHTLENSEETLVLIFSGNEVTVKGLSLQPVVEAVKERRLEWLRALPFAYRNQRHHNETFIDYLAVLDVGNLPKSEPIHDGPLSQGRSGGDIRQSVSPTGDFKCTISGI